MLAAEKKLDQIYQNLGKVKKDRITVTKEENKVEVVVNDTAAVEDKENNLVTKKNEVRLPTNFKKEKTNQMDAYQWRHVASERSERGRSNTRRGNH